MTRHIIRISLVMLLGVVTSVAVAWACQLWLPLPQNLESVQIDHWYRPVPDAVGEPARCLERIGFGRRVVTQRAVYMKNVLGVHQSGTPFLCMEYYRFLQDWWSYENRGRLELGEDRFVPYHPILPGLLANTAIYGSAWWAILFGPGVLIRRRRRRAGRCVKCGYILRGSKSDACPECGAVA